MLTERRGADGPALFLNVNRLLAGLRLVLVGSILTLAPKIIRVLAPGLPAAYVPQAITILRIGSLSTVAVGVGAIHSALLFTDRRFAPSAFHQATVNVFTIIGAVSLWKLVGVYRFAIGYMAGALIQLAIV